MRYADPIGPTGRGECWRSSEPRIVWTGIQRYHLGHLLRPQLGAVPADSEQANIEPDQHDDQVHPAQKPCLAKGEPGLARQVVDAHRADQQAEHGGQQAAQVWVKPSLWHR